MISVAVSSTASRLAVELGSRDLTTASINRGRCGYNINGLCDITSASTQQCPAQPTLRIKNATNCITLFRSATDLGFKISNVNTVINNAVCCIAICNTAKRACGPTFWTEICSLRMLVASAKSARNRAMLST